MNRLTLILKPTLQCNCTCKYCITPQNVPKNKISLEDIELLCEKISHSAIFSFFTFIWHGGEPLLMGIPFYKEVFKIQQRILGKGRYKNTYQSNCIMINSDWIDFFLENNITISASLDGDRDSHNINRVRNGEGTFDDAFEKITQLQSAHLLTGVVTVLSKSNIGNIDNILKFFAINKISTRLNPILPSERVLSNYPDLSINSIEYANCLINCFDKWMEGKYNAPNGKPIHIAPLTDIIYNIFNSENPRLCVFSKSCSNNFLAINPDGELYNCGRFCDISEFKIANIHDDFENIDTIFDTKKRLIQWNISLSKDDDKCPNCEWYSICNRGCPNSSYIFSGKILNKDPFCSGYKKLFSHMYNYLRDKLNNV